MGGIRDGNGEVVAGAYGSLSGKGELALWLSALMCLPDALTIYDFTY